MFGFKSNNKSNMINKTRTDEIIDIIERATDTLSFNVELLNCDAALQVRLFSKKKLLRYIELVLADDCDIKVVHPSTKRGVKIWNEKMEEAGRPDMKITYEEALKESEESAAAYKQMKRRHKEQLKEIRNNVKAANKRAKEEDKEETVEKEETTAEKADETSDVKEEETVEKEETTAEKKADKKQAKAEKKAQKKEAKAAKKAEKEEKKKLNKSKGGFVRRVLNILMMIPKIIGDIFKKKDFEDSDIEFEDSIFDVDPDEDPTWIADEEPINWSCITPKAEEKAEEKTVKTDNHPTIVPETEDGVILENGEPTIIYDAAATEHPTDDEPETEETKTEELEDDFDANTGFVKPEFPTEKEITITFDNDKLAMATFDAHGNLMVDPADRSYDDFHKIYPDIEILWKIAKSASLKIMFYPYLIEGRQGRIPVENMLVADIHDVAGNFIKRIFIDINRVYGNGMNVILCEKQDLLEEFFVNVSNMDLLTAVITRNLTEQEKAIEMAKYPKSLKEVVRHVDIPSLGKTFSNKQYCRIVDACNAILFKNTWDKDFDPKDYRFRFDNFMATDKFNLISDELVKYIPNTRQNIFVPGSKRYWISYNGRKKLNERVEFGVLELPNSNPLDPNNSTVAS